MKHHSQHAGRNAGCMVRLGVLCLALVVAGCSTVHPPSSIGTGRYSAVSGRLTWTYPVTLQVLQEATIAVLSDLHLNIQKQTLDGLGGTIEALRGETTTVYLHLMAESAKTSQLSVRFGTFGNRNESARVHEAVQRRLGF